MSFFGFSSPENSSSPATERQMAYLTSLGYRGTRNLTIARASSLIDEMKHQRFNLNSKKKNQISEFAKELLTRDHTLKGGIIVGIDGYIVDIQARATGVLKKPAPIAEVTTISGMGKGAIKEVLQRIHGAFTKYGIPDSEVQILINLAPANLPKEGTWLDLPLAIIMLQAAGVLPDLHEDLEKSYVLLGEVGIHGEIRRVPGVLSIAFAAGARQRIIVPEENKMECALVKLRPGSEDCFAYPVKTLKEVIEYFEGSRKLESATKTKVEFEAAIDKPVDFSAIRGQEKAKRAALICAAGGHNLLLIGPPGEGKSFLASAIPGILPSLTNAEKAELTRIYSACAQLDHDAMAVTRRPMRTINSTASAQSIVGGGAKIPRPGEITLSHLGVLFMDEFPEFAQGSLESLRGPMESGVVRISRSEASLEFPARFTLVAAMNPCPCGFYSYESCSCRENDVKKYQGKISGPILDRIDLQVELKKLDMNDRFSETESNQTQKYKAIVQRARNRQIARFEGTSIPFNAAMPGGSVRDYCNFSEVGFERYKKIVGENSMSTRSMDRLAKVARTVADIENKETIDPEHIDEAASFVVGGILRDAMK